MVELVKDSPEADFPADIDFLVSVAKDNYKLAKAVGGVKSIPLMLIYDREGKYSQHYIGAVPEEMIEADIKKVL